MSNGNTTTDTESAAKPAPAREKAYLLRPKPVLKAGLEAYRAVWAAGRPGTSVSDQDLISHLCTLGLQRAGQELPEVPA